MAIRLNYQSAALRVCVDKAEDGRFCGRIAGQRLSAPISFADINDFVVQVDALLDAQRFPQAFQKIRTFTDKDVPIVPAAKTKEELSDFDVVNSVCGGIATFSFQVFSRKNASWQGYIDWMNGSEKQRFNSTLEFLKFVDNRLQKWQVYMA